jgi:hypothetical protein
LREAAILDPWDDASITGWEAEDMPTGTIFMLLLAGADAEGQARAGRPAAAAEDPDQVICRQAEPVVGSRVARRRVCRTRAEWRAFEADRAQFRRDLQNSGRGNNVQ